MPLNGATLLVVDGDRAAAERLAAQLSAHGARVLCAFDGSKALRLASERAVDLVISELELPDGDGLGLLRALAERVPGLPVIVVAQGARVPDAVAALRAGAVDFIEKPCDPEQVSFVANKALRGARALIPPALPEDNEGRLLGASPAMRRALATLQRAAEGTATVLVRGESGCGKELVARAIHAASPRAAQAFVKIDCASLPENLLESELFGYERGAFTGAVSRKLGRVELADTGTLFLDEIGELSASLQAKLLRLLQDRQIERLGGTKSIPVDVRVLAATHRDLDGMVERAEFRLDLFYRLNVVPLWIPPLRARRDDIPLLAAEFARKAALANGKAAVTIDASGMAALRNQRWPGNVRQLQNFVERLVVLSSVATITSQEVDAELGAEVSFKTESTAGPGPLSAALLEQARSPARVEDERGGGTGVLPLEQAMRAAEKLTLSNALSHCKGNRSLAARLLGVSRSTLYAKLHEHGLIDGA